MGRIEKLPDEVANQIAAGEVVERPVAVVKELVENSIDAGATRIEVEFRRGGKSLVRVSDNGSGMPREDAEMSLQRHATSKLRKVEDLERLASFGFRGEALPSIASVSQFRMRTRSAAAEEGWELTVRDGARLETRACGMAPGTVVEVAHLFAPVPARRKFLKADRTEAAHIVTLVRLLAVAHPEIEFSLLEDGRPALRCPVVEDRLARIRDVYGRPRSADLISIERADGDTRVHGYIERPGQGRATRADMWCFVNLRPVDNRLLNYALIEAYHGFIPKGRYPAAFLFVDLPPAAVDVNVHPAKREVRFRDEPRIRRVVMETILECLRRHVDNRLERVEYVSPLPKRDRWQHDQRERPGPQDQAWARPPEALRPPRSSSGQRPWDKADPAPEPPVTSRPESVSPDGWRFIRELRERFGLFESPHGLVVVNARAAQERIWFERIEGLLAAGPRRQQSLLFPVSMDLDPLDARVLEEHRDFIASLGFSLEPFGRDFYRLSAIPDWFQPDAAEQFIRDVIGLTRERGLRPDRPDLAQQTVARLAARHALRQLPPLQEADFAGLLRELLSCRQPLTDSEGRPTFVEFDWREIERRLGIR